MVHRLARVVRLDQGVYGEIERDPGATASAAMVVAVVAVVGAVGAGLQKLANDAPHGARPAGAIAGAVAAAFAHWLIWSALTSAIAAVVVHARPTYLTTLRALGYAEAPKVLGVKVLGLFAFIPLVGPVLVLGGQLLALRAGSLGGQDALGLSLKKTIAAILVSFAVAFVVSGLARALLAHVGALAGLVGP